jgi:glycosyltransferase involved in cell wall biosynthesis
VRRLRILWLSHFVPYPPKGGAFQRSYNLMRGVGEAHEVHLLALQHKSSSHPAEELKQARNELGKFCHSVTIVDGTAAARPAGVALRMLGMAAGVPLTVSVSNVASMRRELRSTLARASFDLVHFDTIGLGSYLKEINGVPAVCTHHGAEAYMLLRRVRRERSLVKKALFFADGHLLDSYEHRFLPRFAQNLVCSSLDGQLLARAAPSARFTVIPNGVDVDYFRAMPAVGGHKVVFAGRLDQYSNRDAIRYFTTDVWPRVRRRFADATLDILGANPAEDLVALSKQDSSIRVHGFVPDVRPFFEQATLAVCPIRDGGGTRVKILDNLSMGKPIVSTTIGIEGIDVVPGRDLLIADTAEMFEQQIARIFEDAQLRASLSANARKLAERTYSWSGIVRKLLETYAQARGA